MAPCIYLHIPFCLKKCGYCSFNSCVYDRALARKYMSALNAAVDLFTGDFNARTLYVGGGTPTVIEPSLLAETIRRTASAFGLVPGAEVTLEANPGTLRGYKLSGLLDAGVNRISLGAQSFNDAELGLLGRTHRAADTVDSVRMLRDRGVNNLSLDLMYGIPRQDMRSWAASLNKALELLPEHISAYCLSIEENTRLYRDAASGRFEPLPDGLQADMYAYSVETLEKAGYLRYEISNFALNGFECMHNINYWNGGEYLGLGAGAYSCVGRLRRVNVAGVKPYIDAVLSRRDPACSCEKLTEDDARREFIMLGLRTSAGLDFGEYKSRFGRAFMDEYETRISRLSEAGFIVADSRSASLTGKGIFASNAVISELF